ncbi:uncharacterized protein LOC108677116, partial [Hyalella azteca]|uniref:Uncharacterized protein LOC108677116 n=1 Tax=Hyalella azteca TaxID=294128 RepID=A0A8B7P3Y3_HYAAZ
MLLLHEFSGMEAGERGRPRTGRVPKCQVHKRKRLELDDAVSKQTITKSHVDDQPNSSHDTDRLTLSSSPAPDHVLPLPAYSPSVLHTSGNDATHSSPNDLPPDIPEVINPEKLPLSHPCHPQHRIAVPSPELQWVVKILPHTLTVWKKRRWAIAIVR